jgi:NAD(P)-dependent dehydrogenase (short-subunit alcohol dehydrogenase family)
MGRQGKLMSQSREPGAVVITGASTGIGEACVCRLERMGYRVFAGVRKAADGLALQGKCSDRVQPLILDVTDPVSIERAREVVARAVGPEGLAGLVNNAGIAVACPLEYLPLDELRKQLDINVVGQLAVTQAFLPLLRQAQGRIINMSSVSGLTALPMIGAYAASKFALEGLSDALRLELAPFKVRVSLIEPAAIATPIWDKAAGDWDVLAQRLPAEMNERYGVVGEITRRTARQAGIHGLSAEMVADVVARAMTCRWPRARYLVAKNARLLKLFSLLPDRWRDTLVLGQLRLAGRKISREK